jgi:hypothetical protein
MAELLDHLLIRIVSVLFAIAAAIEWMFCIQKRGHDGHPD